MKKTLLLSLSALLLFTVVNAQVLVSHGFENSNLTSGPTGSWAQISFSPLIWEVNNTTTYVKSGIRSAVIATTVTDGGASNLITHSFAVEAGKTYRITFWYRAKNATDDTRLFVDLLPGQVLGTTLAQLLSKPNINNTTYQQQIIDYTATQTRTVAVNFNGGGFVNTGSLYIDDVEISVLITTATNEYSLVKNSMLKHIVGNPSNNNLSIQFNENFIGLANVQIMNANGIAMMNKQITVNNTTSIQSIPVNHLPSGIYFVKVTDQKGQSSSLKFLKN
jgi:Secretion system C-terminal sorting domain